MMFELLYLSIDPYLAHMDKKSVNSFWAIYEITHNNELFGIDIHMFSTVVNVFILAGYFFRPGRSKNRIVTAVIGRKLSQ